MNVRNSWSAKKDRNSSDAAWNHDADLPLDDLLDARFDEEGRLSHIGRGARQRVAERLDPRPPAMSPEELERAVQKLALGLEAIERHGNTRTSPEIVAARTAAAQAPGGNEGSPRDPDFVTHSLDRLESRLQALSKRLHQRAAANQEAPPKASAPVSADIDDHRSAPLATAAEVLEAEIGAALQADPSLAVEARPNADSSGTELRRQIEAVRARHAADEAAEQRRRADAIGAMAEEPETSEGQLHSEGTDARRATEANEGLRRTEGAAAEQWDATAAAELKRNFAALAARIEELQKSSNENQIQPVRHELMDLLRQIEALGRNGNTIAGAVEQVRARMDDVETKVAAARNLAGNRIGDLQDRLSDVSERLNELEVVAPGLDAVRENQAAILERFDRVETLVRRGASPEELTERVDLLRSELQAIASQREITRIEEQVQRLADRLDSLPEEIDDRGVLQRLEAQLEAVSTELAEARRQRDAGAGELGQQVAQLSAGLKEIGERYPAPDMKGVEERLTEIAARLDDGHRFSTDRLAGLDERLGVLTAALAHEETDGAAEILAGLTRRMDALAAAIEAQDARGDMEGLDRKLGQLFHALAEQAERLSIPQLEPLEKRLDRMQGQLEENARRAALSATQFGPFSQKLQEISERLNGPGFTSRDSELVARLGSIDSTLAARLESIEERLAALAGRNADPRGLHTQLESIVSRLELLKGRSIDPARLTELFDRVDAAMRAGVADERIQRIEKKIEATTIPAERFDRLERTIAESALAGIGDERYDRLETKIAENALAAIAEQRFSRLEQMLQARIPSGIDDERFGRLEQMLQARTPSGIDDERFARLERKLEEIGRARGGTGEGMSQEDIADLSTDITALRRELRSLPGLGDGEAPLGAMLKTIAARLERLPEDPPATAPELEMQIERIAMLMQDPSHSRLALAHIETSLKAIEQRLEETRRTLLYRAEEHAKGTGDEAFETVAGLARALSDDVTVLKSTAEASERKTKDALDAVEDTLQAVVKRMAFLERDADLTAASAEGRRPEPARAPAPAPARRTDTDRLPVAAALPAPAVKPEPRDSAGGGLFSRFTSSQLIKRATGGRAESFSPDDEIDEFADLPLEPGTNVPLDSALTGAPSSDTALMSGARKGKMPARDTEQEYSPRLPSAEPVAGDDFLAAARRAAQAATAEAERREDLQGRTALAHANARTKWRRRGLLAGILAVAIAIAAVQIMRNRPAPSESERAALPPRPAVTEELDAAPRAPAVTADRELPIAPPPVTAAEPELPTVPSAQRAEAPPAAADTSRELPSGQPAQPRFADAETMPAPAEGAMAARGPDAPAAGAAGDDIASVSSGPGVSDAPQSAVNPDAVELPIEIGPSRLRSAALAGDPVAAFEIAARYAEGRGIPQDMAAAVSWYERAAEAELAPAQYRLGSIYEKGLGIPQDFAAAQEWYTLAADAGNVKAMHNLAVLHAEGAGGEPDLELAASLFRQAAEHGVRDSQFNLAILHARGLGVRQDMLEAYKWFAIAASSGDPEAAKRRDVIAASLSESSLAKAQAAAAAFQPLPLITEANEVTTPEGGWGEDTTSVELETTTDLVALVQLLLAEQGYDPGPTDGLLGLKTIQAIAAFQREIGLPATGQIDAGLVAALQAPST
jgi:localization factor PodJL